MGRHFGGQITSETLPLQCLHHSLSPFLKFQDKQPSSQFTTSFLCSRALPSHSQRCSKSQEILLTPRKERTERAPRHEGECEKAGPFLLPPGRPSPPVHLLLVFAAPLHPQTTTGFQGQMSSVVCVDSSSPGRRDSEHREHSPASEMSCRLSLLGLSHQETTGGREIFKK